MEHADDPVFVAGRIGATSSWWRSAGRHVVSCLQEPEAGPYSWLTDGQLLGPSPCGSLDGIPMGAQRDESEIASIKRNGTQGAEAAGGRAASAAL